MDNHGQHWQNQQDPFATGITPGAGTVPESINSSPDNLNTGNFEHKFGEMGKAALEELPLPEPPAPNSEIEYVYNQEQTSPLGEVTNYLPTQADRPDATENSDIPHNLDNREKIENFCAKEVEELRKSGNIAKFYDDITNARKTNLKGAA